MLIQLGWSATISDPCVYYRCLHDRCQLIVVYVDDLIITYTNEKEIDPLIEGLTRKVKVADLGELKHALGLDFANRDGRFFVSQEQYVLEILKRFGFDKCHPCPTPMREEYEGSIFDKETSLSKF